MLNIIAFYDNGAQYDVLEMSKEALIDWVWYENAYEEYDSIIVDGVEAAEIAGVEVN